MRLDETDLKLLRLVQEGAREPIRTLAERIALSHNGTLNRLNRLGDSGEILRYMADIDEDIRPVINVSWEDTQAYITWLNQKTDLTDRAERYRLLSEAEWEYAARAGSQTRWSFGDDESRLGNFEWFSDNSGRRTQPVGSKAANAFGLHDMHGNVHEWVEDCFYTYFGAHSDGLATATGDCSLRAFRGGSWMSPLQYTRSAFRLAYTLHTRNSYQGFRLVRTLP